MPSLIDLSHDITHGMVTYPGLPGPDISDHLTREAAERHYGPGTTFHIARISMVANTGTYVDAPSHRFADADDLAMLSLRSLANLDAIRVPAGSAKAITPGHVSGIAVRGRAVLFHTGWSKHWRTPAYAEDAPYVSSETAELLVAQRAMVVGIDSVNIDDMADPLRPSHTALLAAGIPIVEHLTNLDQLPEEGFRFFAVPPKIRSVGTFPVRAFAIVG